MNDVADRCFVAVDPDDGTRHALAAHVEAAMDRHSRGRMPGTPVPVANWHITLRFLGPTGDIARDLVLRHLEEGLQAVGPFSLRFGGLGAFPRPARAGVLWLGLSAGEGELTTVADVVEDAAVAAGFTPEDRPFHPHLTLSRIRPTADVRALVEAVEPAPVRMQVGGVTLFRTVRGPGRARYEKIDTVPLG